ncbi:ABC transporter substrate-binding protein [Clostridium cellulovorans]|uniref:Extracellular solute-binding protein family 1 n=1 Tax=Clostridium cellulovorans (strain ATCC 35296 / DSM 3052 / OCM 3 / 743B) TaxID=573061 RepID=D9SM84_CLOC7|nr:extracellular solute-binding protein [Clostridium cellulovorans]ADL53740.1 extracellular solute-binding protein family 1 [Clostridium cellulovorans 743B]
MNFKKIIATALTAMMTFSLVGCGSSSSSNTSDSKTSTDKTVTIWAWDETFNIKALNEAKDIYLKDNPDVKFNIVTMAQNDIVQKLNTSLSSGTYDGLPNIVLIEDYKAPGYLNAYPEDFKDISGSIDASKFMDYKLDIMKNGDKLYGVPFDSGVTALFYRTDYIEQAGYKKEDMKDMTWEKYIEVGKAVKAKTGKDMLTLDPNDLAQIRVMMQTAGEWYMEKDGKTVNLADNQALKDSITVYKNLLDAGIVKQVSDWDSFVGAFQKGDVATVPTGCWIASSVQTAKDQSGKWAVTSIPRLGANSKSVNASNLGGSSWYVLDKVTGSDLATDFLAKTFAASNELMNDLAKDINLVSTLKSSSTGENYSKPSEFFGGQEIFKDFSTWTAKIPPVNYGLHTYAIESIMTEAVQAIVGGSDMDSTLKNAQTQAEAAVKN